MTNNNLDMSTSLRCSVFVMLVMSMCVCAEVNFGVSFASDRIMETSGNRELFLFDVMYNTNPTPKGDYDILKEYGKECILKFQSFPFRVENPNKSALNSGFFVAVDKNRYDNVETSPFKRNITVGDDEELCFTWGSWLPSEGNEKNEAKFYFHFFTSISDLMNRYFFLFNIEALATELKVKVGVESLESSSNEDFRVIPNMFSITERPCPAGGKEKNTKLSTYKDFAHSGTGIFKMFLLVSRSEEDVYLTKIIDDYLNGKSITLGLKDNYWKYMTCIDNGFEFLHEAPKVIYVKDRLAI